MLKGLLRVFSHLAVLAAVLFAALAAYYYVNDHRSGYIEIYDDMGKE